MRRRCSKSWKHREQIGQKFVEVNTKIELEINFKTAKPWMRERKRHEVDGPLRLADMVDEPIEILRRRGRLTYRALRLQFNLDDEYLDVLKDELIYGQQLARDEDGRVLIWTGEAAAPPEPASTSTPPPPFRAEPAPPEPRTPDAERRQLAVMFHAALPGVWRRDAADHRRHHPSRRYPQDSAPSEARHRPAADR
jgi:hypothetical protein